MVEETKIKLWHVAQVVLGSLMVASILGLAGSLISIRDAVRKHDLLINQSVSFHEEGGRYTEEHGDRERESRIAADARLSGDIEGIHTILTTGNSREHDTLLLMEQRVQRLDDSMEKVWGVVNTHISTSLKDTMKNHYPDALSKSGEK